MKRKVVKHGSATLTVSLPSKWAKRYNIQSGDELEILEDKGRLMISGDKDIQNVKEVRFDLAHYPSLGKRIIGAFYKSGCDVIYIKYNHNNDVEVIEQTLNELIGFEIMQHKNGYVVLKEITGFGHKNELENMIKRTFLLLNSMASDVHDSIKQNDLDVLSKIQKRDISINRFANYCRRVLNKKGASNIKDTPMIYYVIEEIENLGDEYKYLSNFIIKNKFEMNKSELMQILGDINILIHDFYMLYFKFSNDRAEKINDQINKIKNNINVLFESENGVAQTRILDRFARMVLIIQNMMGPLLTMHVPDRHILMKK